MATAHHSSLNDNKTTQSIDSIYQNEKGSNDGRGNASVRKREN